MRLRSKLLRTALGLSYALGGAAVWNRLRGGNIKILMYHGVSGKTAFNSVMNYYGYNVTVADFTRQMKALKRHCNIISLQDLLAGKGLSQSRTNVIITFDDGYENLYHQAFPILKQFSLPAVIGLPTAFIFEQQPLWNDIVEHAVLNTALNDVKFSWEDEEREFSLRNFPGRLSLYEWLLYKCVTVQQENRKDLLALISAKLEISIKPELVFNEDDYRPLTTEQIRKMLNFGLFEFASHSVNHLLLAKMTTKQKRIELIKSKENVEKLTESVCTSFCVPGGSYDSELVEEAFQAGYNCVLTSDMGLVKPTDRVLNRNCILHDYKMSKFVDMVYGPVQEILLSGRQIFAAR